MCKKHTHTHTCTHTRAVSIRLNEFGEMNRTLYPMMVGIEIRFTFLHIVIQLFQNHLLSRLYLLHWIAVTLCKTFTDHIDFWILLFLYSTLFHWPICLSYANTIWFLFLWALFFFLFFWPPFKTFTIFYFSSFGGYSKISHAHLRLYFKNYYLHGAS